MAVLLHLCGKYWQLWFYEIHQKTNRKYTSYLQCSKKWNLLVSSFETTKSEKFLKYSQGEMGQKVKILPVHIGTEIE